MRIGGLLLQQISKKRLRILSSKMRAAIVLSLSLSNIVSVSAQAPPSCCAYGGMGAVTLLGRGIIDFGASQRSVSLPASLGLGVDPSQGFASVLVFPASGACCFGRARLPFTPLPFRSSPFPPPCPSLSYLPLVGGLPFPPPPFFFSSSLHAPPLFTIQPTPS